MIDVGYGANSLADLMARHDLLPGYQANKQQLAAFLPGFLDALPGFAKRASDTEDLAAIEKAATAIRATASDVVIFGTGGSSLGAQAALAAGYYGGQTGPHIHTPDSLDPFEMERLFAELDPKTTHVLAISKSGTTAETLAQVLVTRAWMEDHLDGDTLGQHFTFVTEPGDRPLRRYGEALGSTILDHPTDVGGRYSVLTVVGMLPMAIRGLNPAAFRKGAKTLLDQVIADKENSLPAEGASFIHTCQQHLDMQETLLMAYADILRPFTRWHGQLWAESLGKDGKGITPIRAIGPVDQHSQLQLFLDGPNSRSVTLITLPSYGNGPRVDKDAAISMGLDYMAGKTIGDTVTCQAKATGNALRERGRLVRDLTIKALDEETLGALFMAFMLETVFAAELLGVNAFDQPAVEDGKILTRQYLADL